MPLNPPTAAQLRGARRELRRRPRPIPADLTLGRLPSPVMRARFRVRDLYSSLRDVPDFMLDAAAILDPPPRCCRWGPARLVARVHRQRLPITRETRYLLGRMCAGCAAALLPKPKPRPQARARSSTAGYRRVLLAAGRPAAALDPAAGITAQQAQYNRAAMVRLGMDPAKAPHLTRPTVGAR